MSINLKLKYGLLALAALCAAGLLAYGPIAQWASYHDFADKRSFCGVPNFFDVISNCTFLFAGLFVLFNINSFKLDENYNRFFYWAMGVSLVSLFIGSVFYHLSPSNPRLVWDRLPIASFFSLLFLQILFETKIIKTTTRSYLLALTYWYISCSSVFVWFYSSDLRLYAFAQFFPLISIIVLLLVFMFYPAYKIYSKLFSILIAGYGTAKMFETFDYQTLSITSGLLSGHTIKHLTAGLGILIYFIIKKKQLTSK